MPKFTTGQLTLYLWVGAAVLAGGILTVALSHLETLQEQGVPEFLLFTRRLGWTVIISSAVWEAITFMNLLLCLTETNQVSRQAKGQSHEQASQR